MKNKYIKKFLATVFSHHFYGPLVEKYQIHFNQPKAYLAQFNSPTPRTFGQFYFPVAFFFWFGATIRWASVNPPPKHGPANPMTYFYYFTPPGSEVEFGNVELVCSWFSLFYVLVTSITPLKDFQYLAVILVRDGPKNSQKKPSVGITRGDLDLSEKLYLKLNKFRTIWMRAMSNYMKELFTIGFLTWNLSSYLNGLWHRDLMWGFFYAVFTFYWHFHVVYVIFSLPFIILLVIYYLWLKQGHLLSMIDQLNERQSSFGRPKVLRHLRQIFLTYTKLYLEIQTYAHPISRILSIQFLAWIADISIFQIMIYHNQEKTFKLLWLVCQNSMLFNLTVLALGTAQISKLNRHLGIRMHRFYHHARRRKLLTGVSHLKLQTMVDNIITKKIGFKLHNGTRITTSFLFVMYGYITTFYFLGFRNHFKRLSTQLPE